MPVLTTTRAPSPVMRCEDDIPGEQYTPAPTSIAAGAAAGDTAKKSGCARTYSLTIAADASASEPACQTGGRRTRSRRHSSSRRLNAEPVKRVENGPVGRLGAVVR